MKTTVIKSDTLAVICRQRAHEGSGNTLQAVHGAVIKSLGIRLVGHFYCAVCSNLFVYGLTLAGVSYCMQLVLQEETFQ